MGELNSTKPVSYRIAAAVIGTFSAVQFQDLNDSSGQRPATPNALQLANSRSNKQTKIIIIIKEIIKKNLSKPRKLNLTNNKKKKRNIMPILCTGTYLF